MTANAENRVQFRVGEYGKPGTTDTIFVGGHYEFQYWLENDYLVGGIDIPFEVGSEQNLTWQWLAQPDGKGLMTQCVTPILESRMEGGAALDMTGLIVTEWNYSAFGSGMDTMGVSGQAMQRGLPPGPLEHMISVHFRMNAPDGPWENGVIGYMCMDTACYFFCNDIRGYCNMYGICEFIGVESGCWPVKLLCGNPNGDNDVNVGDAVFMINYVFRDGPAPDPWQLGDANCDGTLDVGDIVFLIAASFRYGPQPQCCE